MIGCVEALLTWFEKIKEGSKIQQTEVINIAFTCTLEILQFTPQPTLGAENEDTLNRREDSLIKYIF